MRALDEQFAGLVCDRHDSWISGQSSPTRIQELSMSNSLEIIPSLSLDHVLGGAGVGVNANVDAKVDVNEGIRDVGAGAGRLLGCATGASSMREFGNCVLTGKLGEVPAKPQ
jgi:hypothetical protein